VGRLTPARPATTRPGLETLAGPGEDRS
jgi:hypothetical protein